MKNKLTICGVPVEAFADKPTGEEVGELASSLPFEEQAEMFGSMWNWIVKTKGLHHVNARVELLAEAIIEIDDREGMDYASGFLASIVERVAALRAMRR